MKTYINIPLCFCRRFSLAALGLICIAGAAQAADRQKPPMNMLGAAVRDAEGHGINYRREELVRDGTALLTPRLTAWTARRMSRRRDSCLRGASRPFWQYAIFGSGIGVSNIIIGPAPAGGGAREIIIGGNSTNDFGPDDFWQVIRHNSATTGNYDQLFVSPIYSARIKRIAIGNVLGDSQQEIAVMLADGRIYLYDLATKTELGSINTGISGLEGLSLTDLDGDGYAELIVTTANDLFVFNGAGSLLWQVAGAGGLRSGRGADGQRSRRSKSRRPKAPWWMPLRTPSSGRAAGRFRDLT